MVAEIAEIRDMQLKILKNSNENSGQCPDRH